MTAAPAWRGPALRALFAALIALCIAVDPAGAQGLEWTIRRGDVRVRCPLTIGGSFEAKTQMITGSVRAASASNEALTGEIAVDLAGLDTGISLRNQHLRDNYLEVARGPDFARAVLTGVRLAGLSPSAPDGKGTFTGSLRLHGVERMVSGQAEIRRSGAGIRVRASFPVSLENFAIAEPRYLGVGVKDEVSVQVSFDATSGENTR